MKGAGTDQGIRKTQKKASIRNRKNNKRSEVDKERWSV